MLVYASLGLVDGLGHTRVYVCVCRSVWDSGACEHGEVVGKDLGPSNSTRGIQMNRVCELKEIQSIVHRACYFPSTRVARVHITNSDV